MISSRAACSRCVALLRHARIEPSFSAAYSTVPDAAISRPGANEQTSNRPRSRKGQKHGTNRPKRPHVPKESAFDVFNDVVDASRDQQSSEASQLSTLLNELELESKVRQLMAEDVALPLKLEKFNTTVWHHLQGLSRIPPQLRKTTADFVVSSCEEMVQSGQVENSVAIARIANHIGRATPDMLSGLVLNLCHVLTNGSSDAAFQEVAEKELNDLWKLITQSGRRIHGEDLRYYLPFTDPDSEAASLEDSLASLFPHFYPTQARQLVPGLLATMCVFSDARFSGKAIQEAAAPLINAVSRHVKRGSIVSPLQFGDSQILPKQKQDELAAYVADQWSAATKMLNNERAQWRKGVGHGHRSPIRAFHQSMRTAYRSRNIPAIEAAWKKFAHKLRQSPSLRQQIQQDDENLLDYCVFVFSAIRRPSHLQETMDVMTDLEIQPTLRTYTGMLHGWKICKDVHRVEALWNQLVASGTKLDAFIWTTRISALITMGQPEAGIQALAEMQQIWADAKAKGTVESTPAAVQPTIEVINAALQGIMRLDPQAAQSILAWAQHQEIKPNTATYNIMLRETFRSDARRVHAVMKAMSEDGVEPDNATFTIILEEVLSSTANAEPAEQVESVNQALADMEGAGLRPNLETYAKMLYAVSSLAGGSDEAIDAILQHMKGNRLTMTPHMITILIERALAQEQPNIASVTSLLAKHGMTDVRKGDQTLWERVMSAHAVTGDPTSAMGIFNSLAAKGRPVTSLSCLNDLLHSLRDANMMDTAQGVVNTVIDHKMETIKSSGLADARFWRHHFWHLARDWGLLKDKGPPELMEQLRRN